jgi:hypothetical protein
MFPNVKRCTPYSIVKLVVSITRKYMPNSNIRIVILRFKKKINIQNKK